MHWYHITLIVMTLIAAFASYRVKNALFYIGLGVWSYVVSVFWHVYDMPEPVLFGAFTNLIVCYVIFCNTCRPDVMPRWERAVFRMFIMMLLIDLLYSVGVIKEKVLFAQCLEVANALVLLFIASPGALEWLKKHGDRGNMYYWGILDYIHRSLLCYRETYPRWWKHK